MQGFTPWNNIAELVAVDDLTKPQQFALSKVALCSAGAEVDVLNLILGSDLRHVVQNLARSRETEILTSSLMLSAPSVFMDFPLSAIIDPLNVGAMRENEITGLEVRFQNSREKSSVLDSFAQVLEPICRSSAFFHDVNLILDELFSNAVFNAPFTDFENRHPGAPRDSRDGVNSPKQARLFSGVSATSLVVGCEDAFGSLNVIRFLERIRKCYIDGVKSVINLEPDGGAKIGSYLMFDTCSSMYIGVKQGQKTIVCMAFELARSERQKAAGAKGVHILDIKR